MFQHLLSEITMGAVLCGALLAAPLSAASEKLNAFTHVAFIPEGSDVGTIRFEKAKTVTVRATANDMKSCEQRALQEHRSGSVDCPQAGSSTAAYEITYSFKGEPMASDEYGNRHFTFQVYFRPDELPSAMRKALSGSSKQKRSDVAASFSVSTDDERRSTAPAGYITVRIEPTSAPRTSGSVSAEIKASGK